MINNRTNLPASISTSLSTDDSADMPRSTSTSNSTDIPVSKPIAMPINMSDQRNKMSSSENSYLSESKNLTVFSPQSQAKNRSQSMPAPFQGVPSKAINFVRPKITTNKNIFFQSSVSRVDVEDFMSKIAKAKEAVETQEKLIREAEEEAQAQAKANQNTTSIDPETEDCMFKFSNDDGDFFQPSNTFKI